MERFKIIPERSRIWAEARSSLHPIKAESAGVTGYIEIELNGGAPDLKVAPQGRIDVDVESLKTGNVLYDHELPRQLDTRKFPRIRGEILEVTELDAKRYKVRGNLSLHGVTKTVEGEVTLSVLDDGTFEVEGEKVFDIRDFGLTPPRILMLKVYPDVTVRGRVVAAKQD
ncbi:MAG TPA: YceI family protein [Candidatus Binataceae bacterium]|jgi:polyisoprenoid-binding protein YceI|nr:YceI family protein [Candidatus Binataceae bacterium]